MTGVNNVDYKNYFFFCANKSKLVVNYVNVVLYAFVKRLLLVDRGTTWAAIAVSMQ